ncbi:MAG TPA: hypothetical protein VFS77_20735 [Pyrinomonadaceae bacterium]|nr:hypothetical protein [Pyrinomonadaceae bacterium]
MNNAFHNRGILDVIGRLALLGATGRLQISAGMTDGALFFDNGQLVDARLGRLSGFQAINALASVPDADYDFDPSSAPPLQSSITANERMLLKDFFGIEASQPVDAVSAPEYSSNPPKIPEYDDEATLVREEPVVAEAPTPSPVSDSPLAVSYQPVTRSTLGQSVLVFFVTALVATAVLALIYRLRKPDTAASVAPPVQTGSPAERPQAAQTQPASAVPDLSGNWNVVNTIEQTSYGAYKNMQIGFNVSINQAGKDFTGTGQKISENGRSLPTEGRTPIVVKGTIDGDRVEATFSESGASRKTNGRFVWRIDKESGGLTGTFASSAARSRGKSAARKVL